jgi:hypothetical protein
MFLLDPGINPKIRNSPDFSTWPHFGHFTKLKEPISLPMGNSSVGRMISDLHEMSRDRLVAASKTSWQLEHVCKCVALQSKIPIATLYPVSTLCGISRVAALGYSLVSPSCQA